MGRRRGFTLIELLVVIAIIAIMAAILFPVFLKAKTAAKCGNDVQYQRQVGMGICMYADQNNGLFPFVTRAGTLRHFPSYDVANVNTTISGELVIMLRPYISNKRVYYCPVVEVYGKAYTYDYQSKLSPPFKYIGLYYYAGEGWGGPKPTKQAGSSKRILVSCIGGGVGIGPGGEGMSGHGTARGIFTFADGHAKYVYHYKYPWSYSECGGDSRLLMPKWDQ